MTDSTAARANKYKYPGVNDERYRVARDIIIPVSMDLGATAAQYYAFQPRSNITVLGIAFDVAGEPVVGTTTAPVVSVSIATVEKATLTIPNSTAIGVTVQGDLIDVECDSDEVLAVKVKTTAVGGTVTGMGYMRLTVIDRP